jgi:ABC-type transport system involved in multi-copper enzyme maturation permease subunit
MNTLMVKRLVLKDWYLQRWAVAGTLGGGLLAVAMVGSGQAAATYMGFILTISVLIIIGVHLAMATVLTERKDQTLAFVMSLPISAREYTAAKMLGNLSMFLIPWLILVGANIVIILGSESLPDGAIPITIVMLAEIFVSTCVVLGVALVSESQGWTVAALIAGNLFCNFFIFALFRVPEIAAAAKGSAIIWSGPVMWLLLGEAAALALVITATFVLQNRKTDFI